MRRTWPGGVSFLVLAPQNLFGVIGGVIITRIDSQKTEVGKCNPRTSRKGEVAQNARQICAKVQVSSFRTGTSHEGCANLSQIWNSISDNFMQIPLYNAPFHPQNDFFPSLGLQSITSPPRTLQSEMIAKIVPQMFFYVTEMRCSKKIIPNNSFM